MVPLPEHLEPSCSRQIVHIKRHSEERPLLRPNYCRRQADICLGLSLLAEDSVVAMELIAKANEFLVKAEEAERGDGLQARATRELVLPRYAARQRAARKVRL
jgi:hypothetical protein